MHVCVHVRAYVCVCVHVCGGCGCGVEDVVVVWRMWLWCGGCGCDVEDVVVVWRM